MSRPGLPRPLRGEYRGQLSTQEGLSASVHSSSTTWHRHHWDGQGVKSLVGQTYPRFDAASNTGRWDDMTVVALRLVTR